MAVLLETRMGVREKSLLQPRLCPRPHSTSPLCCSAKFAAAFEEVGIDLWPDDVMVMEPEDLEELRTQLKGVGAKTVHLRKLFAAIAKQRASGAESKVTPTADAPAADSLPGGDDSLPGSVVQRGPGKARWKMFLSHHKQKAAMEV